MVQTLEMLNALVWAVAKLPLTFRPVLHNWSYHNFRGEARRPPLLWLLFGLPTVGWFVALRNPPRGYSVFTLPVLMWEALKHLLHSIKWWWKMDGIVWSTVPVASSGQGSHAD